MYRTPIAMLRAGPESLTCGFIVRSVRARARDIARDNAAERAAVVIDGLARLPGDRNTAGLDLSPFSDRTSDELTIVGTTERQLSTRIEDRLLVFRAGGNCFRRD
ncbi:hypothetical protein ACQR1I_14280 [Bradyrhizobium sp. HKCCYLS2038]|uniref:hypothetical protein n=1 Tax=unclassified Bradyrhizobium TaxID=2631580 RepID=UPI003EC0B6D6